MRSLTSTTAHARRAAARSLLACAVVALAAGTLGCARPPAQSAIATAPAECVLLEGSGTPEAITIALFDRVDPSYAPWGHNPSEALVFHQLYETLLAADCTGRLHPALARSWHREDGGRCWVFALRDGARFWDGSRVTAPDVVASWRDALTLPTGIDSAVADGERTVRVYIARAGDDPPRALCAPAFAVARRSPGSDWPLGTGPYRVAGPDGAATPHTIVLDPAFGARGPRLRFLETAARDSRDLLEGTIDVMVTADRGVLDYASGRASLTTAALPWNRTYVLVAVSRARRIEAGVVVGEISDDLRDGLARDAVRGDARGFRGPSWWDDVGACTQTGAVAVPDATDSPGPWRILYSDGDAVARGLAERIVALAAADPTRTLEAGELALAIPGLAAAPGVVAEGVGERELDASLRQGRDFAYVLALPRSTPLACYEARRLVARAPWLAAAGVDLGRALLPLVDTRAHLVARGDAATITVDGYGGLSIAGAAARGR